MSSFSRGSVFLGLVRHGFQAQRCCAPARPRLLIQARLLLLRSSRTSAFHTSRLRLAVKKIQTVPRIVARIPANRSYAETLALKGTPTVLYEAPSHTWVRFGALNYGILCVVGALVQYFLVFYFPDKERELPRWLFPAYGVICVLLISMGGFFMLRAGGLIKIIRALPATQAAAAGAKKVEAAKSPLWLEVEITRVLPYRSARKSYVPPSAFELPFPLHLFGDVNSLNGQALARARQAQEEAMKKQLEYDRRHLLTAPFRHLRLLLIKMYTGTKRALGYGGYAKVQVGDVTCRLDVMGAWALDKGLALDRLVTIKDDAIPPPGFDLKSTKS
jgi:hypothetical protein